MYIVYIIDKYINYSINLKKKKNVFLHMRPEGVYKIQSIYIVLLYVFEALNHEREMRKTEKEEREREKKYFSD